MSAGSFSHRLYPLPPRTGTRLLDFFLLLVAFHHEHQSPVPFVSNVYSYQETTRQLISSSSFEPETDTVWPEPESSFVKVGVSGSSVSFSKWSSSGSMSTVTS